MAYVDDEGTISPDAPSYGEALRRLQQAEYRLEDYARLKERIEKELDGKRLRIDTLEAELQRKWEELTHPLANEINVLHALWKRACKRRRDLGPDDLEKAARAIDKLGFRKCVEAIAGAAYDPGTSQLRNGTIQRYDDFELVFRNFGKVKQFGERAPKGWQPNAERIAEIGGVSREWVEERLK